MRFIACVLMGVLCACTAKNEGASSGGIPKAKLSSAVQELPKAHAYLVELNWEGLESATQIVRVAPDGTKQALGTTTTSKGKFIDSTAKDDSTYAYSLVDDNSNSVAESKVTIPRDVDLDELKPYTGPIAISKANRVFAGDVTMPFELTINAQKLVGKKENESNRLWLSAPQEPPKEATQNQKKALAGNNLILDVEEITGEFSIVSWGQPGFAAQKDEAGVVIKKSLPSGDAGYIFVHAKQRGNFSVYVHMKKAMGANTEPADVGRCQFVNLYAFNKLQLESNCEGISDGWDGIYNVGVEKWYLVPSFYLNPLVVEDSKVKPQWLRQPSWGEGSVFGMRAKGPEFPVEKLWAPTIAGQMPWATAVETDSLTGDMKLMGEVATELRLLREAFNLTGIRINGHFAEYDKAFDMEKKNPTAQFRVLRQNAREIAKSLTARKIFGMSFVLGGEDKISEIKVREDYTFLAYSGVPRIAPDKLVQALKSGDYSQEPQE